MNGIIAINNCFQNLPARNLSIPKRKLFFFICLNKAFHINFYAKIHKKALVFKISKKSSMFPKIFLSLKAEN